MATYKVLLDESQGCLGVDSGLALSRRRLSIPDLLVVLLDPSQLGEDGVVSRIHAVQVKRRYWWSVSKPLFVYKYSELTEKR